MFLLHYCIIRFCLIAGFFSASLLLHLFLLYSFFVALVHLFLLRLLLLHYRVCLFCALLQLFLLHRCLFFLRCCIGVFVSGVLVLLFSCIGEFVLCFITFSVASVRLFLMHYCVCFCCIISFVFLLYYLLDLFLLHWCVCFCCCIIVFLLQVPCWVQAGLSLVSLHPGIRLSGRVRAADRTFPAEPTEQSVHSGACRLVPRSEQHSAQELVHQSPRRHQRSTAAERSFYIKKKLVVDQYEG